MESNITAARIHELRTQKGWTQDELRKRLKLRSNSIVAMFENGKRKPSVDTLCDLATIFDVTVDYLLGRAESPQNIILEKHQLPKEIAREVDYVEVLRDRNVSPEEFADLLKFIQEIKQRQQKHLE